jgi:murein L,D-transpeptidase YcbB/YkuD
VAVAAIAFYVGVSLDLTGTWAPSTGWDGLVRMVPSRVPTAAEAALRKALSDAAGRANAAPGYAEDLAAATAFYDAHDGRLLWVTDSGLSERAGAIIGEIRKADDWGLQARDFVLPKLSAGAVSPEAAAAAEMAVTLAVLKYARHARGGRLGDPSGISKVLDARPPLLRPGDVLASIAANDAPDAYLRSLHPQHEQFEKLRRALLKLRGPDATASFEPGREDAEKAVLMARILVNMERWRWLPADLGAFYVWNNVPEFVTRIVRRGATIHSDTIVAGQPDWATPVFSASMRTIVFHPSWGVPDGIKRKELWPLLRDGSQNGLLSFFTGTPSARAVLEHYKLQAYYQGRPIDPDEVDWSKANIGAYEFRQEPGPTNPLGSLKFSFPNKYDVYMHDTPERDDFAREFRGLSHGCMRVSEPRRLAAILLAQDKGWSEKEVEALLNESGGTSEVKLTTPIPVHMTYFTAMVDGQGSLQTFGDLYGIDTRMGAVLFGGKVPFVTPRYDDEIKAARNGPATASREPTLADVIASIFSP